MAAIFGQIEMGPKSVEDVATALNMDRRTVAHYIEELHDDCRIRVCEWRQPRQACGRRVKVYEPVKDGFIKDAEKPAPLRVRNREKFEAERKEMELRERMRKPPAARALDGAKARARKSITSILLGL